jgi:hypothetical protein
MVEAAVVCDFKKLSSRYQDVLYFVKHISDVAISGLKLLPFLGITFETKNNVFNSHFSISSDRPPFFLLSPCAK